MTTHPKTPRRPELWNAQSGTAGSERSFHRGHAMHYDGEAWVYTDTGQRVADHPDRDCGVCGKPNTPEGHDACLGTIPGAMNACCGHGEPARAYVQYPSRPA